MVSTKGEVVRPGVALVGRGTCTPPSVTKFTLMTRESKGWVGSKSEVVLGRGATAFMTAEQAAAEEQKVEAPSPPDSMLSNTPKERALPRRMPFTLPLGKAENLVLAAPAVSFTGDSPHWITWTCTGEAKNAGPRAVMTPWEMATEGGGAAAMTEAGVVMGRRDTPGPQQGFKGGLTGRVVGALPDTRMATTVMSEPQ